MRLEGRLGTREVGDSESSEFCSPPLLSVLLFAALVIRSLKAVMAATFELDGGHRKQGKMSSTKRSPIEPCWLVGLLEQLIGPGRLKRNATMSLS